MWSGEIGHSEAWHCASGTPGSATAQTSWLFHPPGYDSETADMLAIYNLA